MNFVLPNTRVSLAIHKIQGYLGKSRLGGNEQYLNPKGGVCVSNLGKSRLGGNAQYVKYLAI